MTDAADKVAAKIMDDYRERGGDTSKIMSEGAMAHMIRQRAGAINQEPEPQTTEQLLEWINRDLTYLAGAVDAMKNNSLVHKVENLRRCFKKLISILDDEVAARTN